MEILERLARIRRKLLIAVGLLLLILAVFVVSAGIFLWASAPRESAQIVENRIGMKFVSLPAGSFIMGSENGQADEKPAHQVTISKGFLMGRYEVTQGQWKTVLGCDPVNFKGNDFPTHFVTWNETHEFLARLNQMNDGLTRELRR